MRQRGFTLVELLVALMVMALLSLMSWRGIDGMARASAQTQERSDALMVVQTGLAQWGADLDAMADLPPVASPNPSLIPNAATPAASAATPAPSALDWNGQALRITRTYQAGADSGLRVVAWSRRDVQGTGQWLRWQSAPLHSRGEWQSAWAQAAVWAQNPDDAARQREVVITPLAQWQIYYFRNDAWSNPLSSAESASATPDGVRLVLTLPPGGALAGELTRDWIRPTVSGNKS